MDERDASHSSLYLLNKKLADLQKVIGIVGFNHDSLINGISTIKNRYYDEMTNILTDYSQIMQNILDELDATRKKSEHEIGMEYSKLYNSIQNQGVSVESEIKKNFENGLSNIDDELFQIVDYVNSIKLKSIKELQLLQESLDLNNFKNKLQSQIDSIKSRIDWDDIESRTKYATLLESAQQKFRKLDETYQKSVIDLKKKFLLTSKNSKVVQQIESYRDACFSLQNLLNDNKQKVLHAQNEYQTLIKQYKENISSFIEEFQNIKKKSAIDISSAREKYEKEDLKLKEILSGYKNIKNQEDNRLTSKINELNLKLNQQRDELNIEYKEKADLYNQNLMINQNQLDELKLKLDQEISNLEKSYENERNKKSEYFKTIVYKPEKDEVEYFNHFGEIQKLHMTEIQMFRDQYNQEIQKENDNFAQSTKGISELLLDLSKLRETKNDLEKLNEDNHQNLIEFDEITRKELNDLQTNFINEQNSMREKYEEEIAKLNTEQNLKISKYNEEMRLKRSKKISETENQRLVYLDTITNEFKNDPEIEKIVNEYSKTFQNLIDEFEKIDKSNETKTEMISINLIENEQETLDDKLNKISKTKLEILKKWQDEINQENKRHQNVLLNLHANQSNEDIESFRNDHLDSIKEKDLLINELNCQLSELEQFKIERNLFDFDDQIEELKETIQKVRIECDEQISQEEKLTEVQLTPLQQEIQNESSLNFKNLQHEKRKIEIEIDDKAKLINSETTKLNEIVTNKNKSLNRQVISFQVTFDNMKCEHKKTVEDLTNQIFQSRGILSELRHAPIDDEIEKIEQKQQMIQKATIAKYRNEIEKLLNTKREIEQDRNQQVRKFELKLKEMKALYATKKCRPEEKKIIDRLKNILDLKNQELTSVFKDLSSYRSHLQTQEELVNMRFGMAPKVGVAMIKPRSVSHLVPLVPH